MKTATIILSLIFIALISYLINDTRSIMRDRVTQGYTSSPYKSGDICLVTYVWYHKEILWSRYDPIDSVLADKDWIERRKNQAEEVLIKISEIEIK